VVFFVFLLGFVKEKLQKQRQHGYPNTQIHDGSMTHGSVQALQIKIGED
jgi:hypothetical protein